MATLVTGGTGFVASNIVRALAERGHDVVSLDVTPPDDLVRRYWEPWKANIAWVQGDILDPADLQRVGRAHQIDKIVHAAVYTGIREDIERSDSRRIVDINLAGTANLLDLARQIGLARFLYVSSGSVYEGMDADGPLIEDSLVRPRSLYAVTKYVSELLTERYGELHGFEAVSVRLGSPFGPMERVTGHRAVMSLMYQWTRMALRGEPIEVEPRGIGDCIYVGDVARGISAVLDAPALSHRVYNLARGVRVSLDELIAAFREAYPNVRFVEPIPQGVQDAFSPPAGRVVDVGRIAADVGFRDQLDLAAGLKAYFKWGEEFGLAALA